MSRADSLRERLEEWLAVALEAFGAARFQPENPRVGLIQLPD
jgi:hypothetical protein